ncbi:MAG TPA: VOC family protein [Bacillota bacterium]|nr:VOC family protein [Bacillota bacterium]
MQLHGIHHISAITKNVQKNYHFFTEILGLQCIKSTVHHEDTTARKLYYASDIQQDEASLAFIERKDASETKKGNNTILDASFRVASQASVIYWKRRFEQFSVNYEEIVLSNDTEVLVFTDFEGHSFHMYANQEDVNIIGTASDIPLEHQIIGLGPCTIKINQIDQTAVVLEDVLSLVHTHSYLSPQQEKKTSVYTFSGKQSHHEIHVEQSNEFTQAKLGYSSFHHLAFRVENITELRKWRDLFERIRMPNSGIINHTYYKSIYFRDGNDILYELATSKPGFTIDEEIDQLGSTLSLPKQLQKQREEIEKELTPLL